MATTLPVLLLEFNELSPRLMDQFMAAGQLPNLKILHDESEIYVTGAVEKYPHLAPWIQWITVHRGLATASPIGGPRMSGVHAQAARGRAGRACQRHPLRLPDDGPARRRVRRLVGEDGTIIFCTALSQQPCVMYEEQGGKVPYSPSRSSSVATDCGSCRTTRCCSIA